MVDQILSEVKPLRFSHQNRSYHYVKFFTYFRKHNIKADDILEFLLGYQIVNSREIPNFLNINRTDEFGHTALHWAGTTQDVQLVEALIKGNACLLSQNKEGLSPLHSAAGHREIMSLILDEKRKRVKDDNVWINTCCWVGNLQSVNSQIKENPGLIHRSDVWGMNPVHWAAAGGHLPVLQFLLDSGAKVDTQDNSGWTPFVWACCFTNNNQVLKYLISKGAKINNLSKVYDQPIHIAASTGNTEAIELLINQGATLDRHNNDGMYPINHAVTNGHDDTIRFLKNQGANINQRSRGGNSCLHQAVANGHFSTFKLLLELGANVEERTNNDTSTLHLAALYGYKNLVKEIIMLNPTLTNCTTKNNETPLFYACLNENTEIVQILLENSANIFIKDTESKTPLDLAVEAENDDLIDLCVSHCVQDPEKSLGRADDGSQGAYATLIAELGIETTIQKYLQNDKSESIKLFYQTHLTIAAKMKNDKLIKTFTDTLLSKDGQWTHQEVFEILHYRNQNWPTFSNTCLNYTNENNDKVNGYRLLKVENYVHNKSTYQLFSCIQQNLNMEALVPWLKMTYLNNLKKGTTPSIEVSDSEKDYKKRLTALTIFTEVGLLSVLPFLIDFFSDIELFRDYNGIANLDHNATHAWDCGDETNLVHLIPYDKIKGMFDFAAKVSIAMVVMNVVVYIYGAKIASPEWLTIWKKGWDETNLQFEFVKEQNMDWYGRKLKDYPIFKQKYFVVQVVYKILLGLSYLLWPLLILMPNNYNYQVSEYSYERREGNARSSTAWRYVKIAESGVENVLQILLQLWLILPVFKQLSEWSWSKIGSHTLEGISNMLSFGNYEACLLDKSLGKLVFTGITCSISLSLFKVDRPGVGVMYKLKAAPVIFVHLFVQIVARLYAVRCLMLLNISFWVKYGIAILIHITILIPIKVITETQKVSVTLGPRAFFQRFFLLLISCISSSIIMIDWHWNSTHLQAPKFMFFSRILFQVLLLLENLVMVLLPVVLSSYYSKDDKEFLVGDPKTDVLVIICMWIVSVSCKALYYKYLHKWSKVMGPRRLLDSSQGSGCDFKTRLCCYEKTQKITFKIKEGFSVGDYEGIQYIPPNVNKDLDEKKRKLSLITCCKLKV